MVPGLQLSRITVLTKIKGFISIVDWNASLLFRRDMLRFLSTSAGQEVEGTQLPLHSNAGPCQYFLPFSLDRHFS